VHHRLRRLTRRSTSSSPWRGAGHFCVFVFLGSLLATGCADDPCADALQKLEDCGVSGGREADDDEECADKRACTAECINEVDCEDIVAPRPDGRYTSCVNECEFGSTTVE